MFVGQTHRRRERLKERIKWRRRRKQEDVPVQSNMPGHPQPEAEKLQRSGRGPGPGPGSGEACQAGVHGDGAATLHPSDVVDANKIQQCGAAQTAGGVSKLPLVVAAGHGQEPDGHGLQVTSLCVCECVCECRIEKLFWRLLELYSKAYNYRAICCHSNPNSIIAKRDGCRLYQLLTLDPLSCVMLTLDFSLISLYCLWIQN